LQAPDLRDGLWQCGAGSGDEIKIGFISASLPVNITVLISNNDQRWSVDNPIWMIP